MVAVSAEVGDALSAEKGIVGLHACFHCAGREARELLVVLLAIHNGGFQGIDIQGGSNGRQVFDGEWGHDDFPILSIEGKLPSHVVHVIVLDSFGNQIADDFRKRQRARQAGKGHPMNDCGVHGRKGRIGFVTMSILQYGC